MSFKRCERLCTDMVFDPFRVEFSCFLCDPEGTQERNNRSMAPVTFFRETSARVGQKDRSVRFTANEACALQTPQRAVDGYVSDAQPPGQISHTRLSHRCSKVCNSFNVILRRL